MDTHTLDLLLIHGYSGLHHKHIPNEIALLITRYIVPILPFSEEYMSNWSKWELSDDRKCIKRTSSGQYAYILSDIDPVTSGVHCWRVKITQARDSNHWVMFGVSEKKRFKDHSFRDAYGVSCCKWSTTNYFANHNKRIKTNAVNTEHFHRATEVDILLDVDDGKLNICEAGNRSEKEAILWNLPQPYPNAMSGWVPHLNCARDAAGIQLKVEKIPISWYGTLGPKTQIVNPKF
eukprot:22309_1